ncbi:tetratricopeptide repeat-containing sulfotransferase family protein [Parvibaculum sp.]|uniref:tetratricopeptide repeat-containing sulfotransferase family protein n=1 Tax=Parvibaculum sp. TaxID=2024848 RepID=UPI00391B68D7
MTKSSPPKGPGKPFQTGLAPQGGFRPTVGLPPSAGGARPTVPLPGMARGAPAGVSKDDIIRLLKLGGAHLAAGRPDHAAKAAAAILQVEPKNPDAIHLIGLVALAKGDTAKAEQLIAAAAALMPHHPNVWVNLGNAQRDQGKVDEALIAYRRAETIDPAYPDLYLNRGQLHQDNSDHADAMENFGRLIELKPDEASSYMRAASAANDAGLFREAAEYCKQALQAQGGEPAQIMAILATTHERLGELDEAIRWAEKALETQPKDAGALRTWAKARRRKDKKNKALLAELRARLESVAAGPMRAPDARLILSELGQICDEMGDFEAAFAHFEQMNRRTSELKSLERVDRGKFIGEVEELLRLATEETVRRMSVLPGIGKEPGHAAAPVFLVGFPRSGTTLLDQILDAHPGVQVLEELPLLNAVKKIFHGYPETLFTLDEAERLRLRDVYWSEIREAGADLEGKVVIDKMPLNMVHAGLIARVFPEAKMILALRHPADCVLSCFMQDFVPNGAMLNFLTLEGSARFYDRVFTLWEQYRALLPLNVQEVRYENLVADLRAEVEPVLDFLGLGWNDAVSDPAAHALQRGTIRTPSYSQVTQPIYSSSTERWRHYEAQMRPVLPVLAPHVERLGYSL